MQKSETESNTDWLDCVVVAYQNTEQQTKDLI